MAFPDYKKKWYWLIAQEDGWENLGFKEKTPRLDLGWGIVEVTKHDFCGERISVGKENQQLFYFCDRCLVKVN